MNNTAVIASSASIMFGANDTTGWRRKWRQLGTPIHAVSGKHSVHSFIHAHHLLPYIKYQPAWHMHTYYAGVLENTKFHLATSVFWHLMSFLLLRCIQFSAWLSIINASIIFFCFILWLNWKVLMLSWLGESWSWSEKVGLVPKTSMQTVIDDHASQ